MVPFLRCLYSCRQWTFSRPLGRCWPPVASILLAAYTAAETMYNNDVQHPHLLWKVDNKIPGSQADIQWRHVNVQLMSKDQIRTELLEKRHQHLDTIVAGGGRSSLLYSCTLYCKQLWVVPITAHAPVYNLHQYTSAVYLVPMALRHMYHTPPNTVPSHLQSIKIPLVA